MDDMHVEMTDHCDSNDKERRESFWIETLQAMYPYAIWTEF